MNRLDLIKIQYLSLGKKEVKAKAQNYRNRWKLGMMIEKDKIIAINNYK